MFTKQDCLTWILAPLTAISMSVVSTSLPVKAERDAGDRGSCEITKPSNAVTNSSLTVLIPIKEKVKTSIAQPKLWLYSPFSSASNLSAELILKNRQGKEVARSALISLPSTSGIVSIELPKTLPQNAPHQFFFSVNCEVAGSRKTLEVSGWISWVKPNANLLTQLKTAKSLEQTVNLYAEAGYWADALTVLAENRDKDPQAAKLWTELFATEKLAHIASKPILPCCSIQRRGYRQLPTNTKGAQ